MTISALTSALSGLRISQQQIDVISTNVANVGTEGYTRKILPQSSLVSEGVTIGVSAEKIIRQVDLNLEKNLWTQISGTSQLNIKASYLENIEQFHGSSDKEISISAELARLQDAFSELAITPEDNQLQLAVVNQALDVANKINDFDDLINTLRNDAQDEMGTSIARANDLLEQIADLNNQIQENAVFNRTTASLEDQRDSAIKELSGIIEISFFVQGDGVMVVQTSEGVELAAERAQELYFNATPIGAGSLYPDNAGGIYVGNPITNPTTAIEITTDDIGGKLGGLLELRDEIFPKQQAQLDELAHKMALRFEAQGLRLFTDESGAIPSDTAPTPEVTLPLPGTPAIPVEYVGFAGEITVNQAIIDDPTLVQQGTATTDVPVQSASNEVIRRIIEFTFGDVAYEQAVGTTDVRVGGAATSLQEWLGVYSENQITTLRDIAAFGNLATAAGSPFAIPGTDTFSITVDPSGEGVGPTAYVININTLPAPQDANELATAITALDPDLSASVNANGELEIESRWDIEIADVNIGTAGFQYLGLNPGTYEAEDPFIDVQVGNDDPVRIYIEPGDTEAELIDKLILDPAIANDTGVPGLAYDAVTFAATGQLILRAGDDFTNPEFGGDIKITTGASEVDAANAEINVLTPGTLPDGVNLVSAIFGSFNASGQDISPISDVTYSSEVLNGSGTFLSFREDNLGADLSISTNIIGETSLTGFAQKMVNEHIQELILTQNRIADEESLQELLETQLLNESGVNIDEELSSLIVVQTAYSASARVVTAVDEMFQELLNAVR